MWSSKYFTFTIFPSLQSFSRGFLSRDSILEYLKNAWENRQNPLKIINVLGKTQPRQCTHATGKYYEEYPSRKTTQNVPIFILFCK